eukprot:c26966_g1_i1.p1 GENE.c26966_g1_i1~~c26966_g1_i1.p1  ORF type:complete len:221 (+),score=64.69 c26966_g1_i1:49-711(+)
MADDDLDDIDFDDDETNNNKDSTQGHSTTATNTATAAPKSLFDTATTELSSKFVAPLPAPTAHNDDDSDDDRDDDDSDHDDQKSVGDKPVVLTPRQRLRRITSQRERAIARSMTPEQHDRFETYLKSTIPKAAVREAMTTATSDKITLNDNCVTFMRGAAKVLVGELVEEALKIAQRDKTHAPGDALAPRHVLEAHRRLAVQGKVAKFSRMAAPKRLFRR